MKAMIFKIVFFTIFIFTGIAFSENKSNFEVKENTNLKSERVKLTSDRVKQIVIARIPGSTVKDIKEFHFENETYRGVMTYNGLKYEFIIDAYTGRAIKWNSE